MTTRNEGVSAIVAYGERGEIGQAGDMPWGRELRSDLRRFRELTLGKAVIIGRVTFESIGSPLSGRENIVISRTLQKPEGVQVVASLAEALETARIRKPDTPPFIIGGTRVYQEAMPLVDTLYATEVHAEFRFADSFFKLPDTSVWHEVSREPAIEPDSTFEYDFVTYVRKTTV